MRGREKDSVVTGKEVATRRLSRSGRHPLHVAAVDTHDVLLIAQAPVARRLKDQSLAVMTEIGLGILAPEGERADVAQVALPGSRRDLARRRRFVRRYLMAPRGAGPESKGRHSRENGGPSGLRSTAEHARLHAPNLRHDV